MRVFASWPTWEQAAQGLEPYLPADRIAALGDAYAFAVAWHGDQRRPAGEPYSSHLLEVVEILVRHVGVTDPDLLTTALVHDVVEDTDCTLARVSARFGRRVGELVDWLTKPEPAPGATPDAAREAYLTRLQNAPGEALLVKLADRYSNVQCLDTHPRPAERRAYYEETCRVFLPIARSMPPFARLFDDWRDHYDHLAP